GRGTDLHDARRRPRDPRRMADLAAPILARTTFAARAPVALAAIVSAVGAPALAPVATGAPVSTGAPVAACPAVLHKRSLTHVADGTSAESNRPRRGAVRPGAPRRDRRSRGASRDDRPGGDTSRPEHRPGQLHHAARGRLRPRDRCDPGRRLP